MAARFQAELAEPSPATIERWQKLFHFADPREAVLAHRAALEPPTVSDAHRDEVRAARDRRGHDRESYEYGLATAGRAARRRRARTC